VRPVRRVHGIVAAQKRVAIDVALEIIDAPEPDDVGADRHALAARTEPGDRSRRVVAERALALAERAIPIAGHLAWCYHADTFAHRGRM
jgi:hypothetical protein